MFEGIREGIRLAKVRVELEIEIRNNGFRVLYYPNHRQILEQLSQLYPTFAEIYQIFQTSNAEGFTEYISHTVVVKTTTNALYIAQDLAHELAHVLVQDQEETGKWHSPQFFRTVAEIFSRYGIPLGEDEDERNYDPEDGSRLLGRHYLPGETGETHVY
jgi:hypothetical protein